MKLPALRVWNAAIARQVVVNSVMGQLVSLWVLIQWRCWLLRAAVQPENWKYAQGAH